MSLHIIAEVSLLLAYLRCGLQDVTGDAISRVNSYNWTGSTPPRKRALLLDISRYNDTAWDTYSRLVRTLDHMKGTFWTALSASVNALPTVDEFRLLQVSTQS